jgi:MYXO-CTERM domain-containing protein
MIYTVGAGQTYASPCALAAAVTLAPGDVIEVEPGTYTDACQLTASGTAQAPIVLRGMAGMPRPVFDATGLDLSGSGQVPRAIFQFNGASYWQVQHLELEHAANASNNGSGFRLTAGAHDVTFDDMSIHDNQDGAQSDGPSVIMIENSDIYANGANDGQSHNLYLQGDVVRLIGNHIHDSRGGQNIKLRTRYVELIGNYVENAGNYEVDLIQGPYTSMPDANAVLIGNVFVRATSADNNSQTILFGTDNPNDTTPSRNGALYAIGNTFVLRNASNQLFHVLTSTPAPAATHVYLFDNIIHATVAGTQLTSDATTAGYVSGSTNFITTGIGGVPASVTQTISGADPGFAAAGDYHLAAGSPAIDTGMAHPMYADGSGAMVDGTPMVESTPPIGTEPRYVVGAALDLGAFEYGNAPPDGGADGGATSPDAPGAAGKHGGCGCASGGDAPGGWLLLGLVVASLGRRRRG